MGFIIKPDLNNEVLTSLRPSRCLRFLLALALIFIIGSTVHAQSGPYPSSSVQIIVGFSPGGGVDTVARLLSQKMSEIWGQPVVVENRPGASTAIATRYVAGSAPDGLIVLINSNSMVVNQIANPNAGYDIMRELIPVANVVWQPCVIVAKNDLPASTLDDVISLARERELSYSSPGVASITHLGAVYLFNMLAKVELLHVPYKGGSPALTAVAGGQTDLCYVTLPPALPLINANKVKPIAVTTAKRSASLPNVPTVAESGFPGYEVGVFTGYFMPAGTPQNVIDAFRETVIKILAMPDIQKRLGDLGYVQADPAKEDFPKIVSNELDQWAKVVKVSGLKVE